MKKSMVAIALVLALAGCKEQARRDDFADKCHRDGGVVRVENGKRVCHHFKGSHR